MNEGQALKDVENSLRDFVSLLLWNKYKEKWTENCGVSEERIKKWGEKREEEKKKLQSAITEDRLIYYSDFYDLKTIIEKHWDSLFQEVFKDKKQFGVYFGTLENYRNPDAHQRELLTHQKHLIIGISGEIRNKIVAYRSKMDTDEDIFPRIESIRDNYGNIWTPNKATTIQTNTILHPDDTLEFIITATDPQGGKIYYGMHPNPTWTEESVITIRISEGHIARSRHFIIVIKSDKNYHADGEYDSVVGFSYPIRPKGQK